MLIHNMNLPNVDHTKRQAFHTEFFNMVYDVKKDLISKIVDKNREWAEDNEERDDHVEFDVESMTTVKGSNEVAARIDNHQAWYYYDSYFSPFFFEMLDRVISGR